MKKISRRHFLRGMGAMLALPYMESLAFARGESASETPRPPNRLVYVYVPNGVYMPSWNMGPGGTLETLLPFQSDVSLISGLSHQHGYSNGDGGGGDHARAATVHLTGVQAKKTEGSDVRAGVSADQIVARTLRATTLLPSLEVGCDPGRPAGHCDPGYSCVYSSNISWRTATEPAPKDVNPGSVFHSLFPRAFPREPGATEVSAEGSILDFISEDAHELRNRLGAADRQRLDEYLDSVRAVEQRIQRQEQDVPGIAVFAGPSGIPESFEAHVRLMYDLIALALQTDRTRVCTFYVDSEASDRCYDWLNLTDSNGKPVRINEGHHDLSHHGKDQSKINKIRAINRFHIGLFGEFLKNVKNTADHEGSLLDHSMIVYGSGLSDGHTHSHRDLPILLAGKGCDSLSLPTQVRYPMDTPVNNLHLSLFDRMGVTLSRFGDSSGRLF